jgi:hypothetical protein
MKKIANTTELQTELQRLLAYSQSELPSRAVLASELQALSERVAGDNKPKCDGASGCEEPVNHIDRKGYAYCEKHAESLAGRPMRKLRPAEVKKLKEGESIKY